MKNVICFFFALVLFGCQKTDDVSFFIPTPSHFPSINHPENNTPSKARLALGKKLFFDTQLSLDSTISCASCHIPEYAFSDTIPLSKGVQGALGKRNAPSILNTAYVPSLNKDGGVPRLDLFALVPIEDHAEMNINPRALADRIATNKELNQEAQLAYGRPIDLSVLTRSLGLYVRSLLSGDSKYDAYLIDSTPLDESEERGRILFHSDKTNCSSCHEGVLLTNNKFENNGSKSVYSDQGRKLITSLETDRAKFRVASLRNVAITGPYMHDGSFNSLKDIIENYNQGGHDHPNKNPLIKPLYLDEQEKADLLAFLHTLSDKKFVYN